MASGVGDIPNLEDASTVGPRPNAQDVLAVAHAQYGATHLLAGLGELVADDGEQQVLPVAVGDALAQAHDPLAAALVLVVLPYGPHALLEEVVVRDQRQGAGPLEVGVDAEEVLDRAHGADGVQRLLVLDVPVGLTDGRAEPENPLVPEGVERLAIRAGDTRDL